MSTTSQDIENLIVLLEKQLGFPIGWKTLRNVRGGRSLILTGCNGTFPHASEARSEFTGYIRGIIEGHRFAQVAPELQGKLDKAHSLLRLFCNRAKALLEATDQDIFTDAPEYREAVKNVHVCWANLWGLVQSLPTHLREPDSKAVEGMKKEETLRQKELEAIQLAADFTQLHLGADEVQCDLNSEVEFVEGGAWVNIRVFVRPDDEFSEASPCSAEYDGEKCFKPEGHDGLHVTDKANWEDEAAQG